MEARRCFIRRLVRKEGWPCAHVGAGFPRMGDGGGDRRKLIIPSQGIGMDKPQGAGPGIIGFVQEGDGAEGRNKFQLPKNFMDRAPGQAQEEQENEWSGRAAHHPDGEDGRVA